MFFSESVVNATKSVTEEKDLPPVIQINGIEIHDKNNAKLSTPTKQLVRFMFSNSLSLYEISHILTFVYRRPEET